jgi:uncharacterized protein (TIGR02246 family)
MTLSAEAEQVALTLMRNYVASFNNNDGHAYGENYWPDADLMGFDGVIYDGREAIVRNHVELWKGPLKGVRVSSVVRRLRSLTPSVMLIDVDLADEVGAPLGSVARIKFVVERRGSEWKIVSAQNTLLSAPRHG